MARRGYRDGDVQVTVWLTRVQRGQLQALAEGGSLQDTVVGLISDEFGRRSRGDRGVGAVAGCASISGERGFGDQPGRGGEGTAGVVADHVAVPVASPIPPVPQALLDASFIERDLPAEARLGRSMEDLITNMYSARRLAAVPVEAEPVIDPFDSDYAPAKRDAKGRLMKPVVRDEWIDTA
jgi:hypothetical protein